MGRREPAHRSAPPCQLREDERTPEYGRVLMLTVPSHDIYGARRLSGWGRHWQHLPSDRLTRDRGPSFPNSI